MGMSIVQYLSLVSSQFFFTSSLRETVQKENFEKAVRLTTWVDPPSPEAVRVL